MRALCAPGRHRLTVAHASHPRLPSLPPPPWQGPSHIPHLFTIDSAKGTGIFSPLLDELKDAIDGSLIHMPDSLTMTIDSLQTVLITGAGGWLGSLLPQTLVERNPNTRFSL